MGQYEDEFGNHMGETMVPELDAAFGFHLDRYKWATSMLPEKSIVLDFGCGIGYGSSVLLEKCSKYVGFDRCESRKNRFEKSYKKENTEFLVLDANQPLPFSNNYFDAVVNFENIEHVENDYLAMSEIYRVLKVGGIYVCSTPINKGQEKGHYHVREYTVEAFKKLVESQFSDVVYYGQNTYSNEFVVNAFDRIYICCVAKKTIKI